MSLNAAVEGLTEIDKALAQRPHKDDLAWQAATKQLCLYRDELIARKRDTGSAEDARQLEHLNAVLSVVAGMHYPLGPIPWDEADKAREWLAALIGQPA